MENEDVRIMINDYIKENLTIITEHKNRCWGEGYIEIKLLLDGEKISSDSFDLG